MKNDFLKIITEHKLETLKVKASYYEDLKKNMKSKLGRRYEVFKKAISRPGQINLIAEIKKASPSAGLICQDFDLRHITKTYMEHKAAAISVLTEDKYFLGSMAYLKQVSDEFHAPTLMKDFIVHEYQIYEGAFYGASAVLLIVDMLSNTQLQELMEIAYRLGLDCLVEVQHEKEIERALEVGAQIIGINNRNLRTLTVDTDNCVRMIGKIPSGRVIVAESGIKTRDDVRRMQQAGAHAVLIGETFMRAADIGARIKEIMGT